MTNHIWPTVPDRVRVTVRTQSGSIYDYEIGAKVSSFDVYGDQLRFISFQREGPPTHLVVRVATSQNPKPGTYTEQEYPLKDVLNVEWIDLRWS